MNNYLTPFQREMLEATFYNLYRGAERCREFPEVLAALPGLSDKELEQAINALLHGSGQIAKAS